MLLSVGVHGALVLALTQAIPKLVEPVSPPPVEVRLIPALPQAFRGAFPPDERPAAPTARAASAVPPAPLHVQPAPEAAARRAAAAAVRTGPAPAARGSVATTQTSPFFVDSLLGCRREDLILMSPDQRQHCEGRIGAAHNPGWMRSPLGCSAETLPRLPPDERADCNRRLGELFAKGASHPVDGVPADKRVQFDALLAAQERRRKGVRGMLDPGDGAEHCTGSNFGMGCLPGRADPTSEQFSPLPGIPTTGSPPP